MLVWAASKRVPRDLLRANLYPATSLDSLLLPWLAPSHQRYLRSRRSSARDLSSLKPHGANFINSNNRTYSTATPPAKAAAEAHAAVRIPDYYQPPPASFYGQHNRGTQQYVTPVDPTKVIILDTPEGVETERRAKMDKNELLALFDACLNTGHLVRAHLMLSQMSSMMDKDSPILVNAHNTFLEALLKKASEPKELRVFFMWYEDKMKAQFNIAGSATTFALLLKASLKYEPLEGQKYLEQYVGAWRQTGHGIGDVLVLPTLTDEEVIKIAKMCQLKVSELHENHRTLLEEPPSHRPSTETLPEIKSVATKGTGLAAIQKSLRSLIDPEHMPQQYSINGKEDLAIQVERQKLLEEDAFSSAQERWKKDHEAMSARGVLPVHQSLNSLLWEWHHAFVPLITEELVRVRAAEKDDRSAGAHERCLYGPFLRLLPPEKIAAIVIVELLKMHNTASHSGVKTSRAVIHVGTMLEAEYLAQEIQKKKNAGLFQHIKNKDKLGELFREDKAAWAQAIKRAREGVPADFAGEVLPEWPVTVKAKLGAVLLTMLLHCAKAPVTAPAGDPNSDTVSLSLPAFYHTYQFVKGKKLGVIRLDPNLLKRLGTEDLNQGILGRLLPMVVKPRSWQAWNDGGYFYTQSQAVRTKGSREQREYVRTASERGDLDNLFASLDVLGNTAWRINRRVFDVLVNVWNSEEEFGEIPAASKDIVLPPEPQKNHDPRVRYKWLEQVRMIKNDVKNNHSQRCCVNFKLEIARAFLFDKFYFPHNVDFRGRAYPIPPNLNHIGDDLSRGLLMFDEGKELGERGLRWLKIHLANLCGVDKVSFDDRESFADEHMEDITDSAKNPLGENQWWRKAEDPWQCLAVCFALADAVAEKDPSKYVCNISVAQDGTCNGLQHYAALGGDMMGAQQVNLLPADKPSDVYTGVADLVTAAVHEEAEGGNELAKLLSGVITRKVVKQTVMTNVYGVTFVGAKAQIANQLKDIEALKDYLLDPKFSHSIMSVYLTRKVFESVKTMFFGANEIQKWLAVCARRISLSISPTQIDYKLRAKECAEEPETPKKAESEDVESGKEHKGKKGKQKKTGEKGEKTKAKSKKKEEEGTRVKSKRKKEIEFMTSVVWTTPLKLPVVQPYRHDKVQVVATNLQNVYITDPTVVDQINSRKQMTAFPPNFIHSLDATHMLLSAMMCHKKSLTFASVHDSFWTHPSDIDTLNQVLREAFIELHSSNVMHNLKEEFEVRYKDYRFLWAIPNKEQITEQIKALRSDYAKNILGKVGSGKKSTLTMEEDLEWERQRDRLISSSNEEERARGLKMITPSVLAEGSGLFKNKIEENAEVDIELGRVDESDGEAELDNVNDVLGDGGLDTIDELELLEGSIGDKNPESETVKKKKKLVSQNLKVTNVWMPLIFPTLPEKGEFDVKKIEKSQYFFS